MNSNFALNPELAKKTLRKIICDKFFAEDFIRRGKKLVGKTADGRKKSSGIIERIREFVAVKDIVALDEILNDIPSVVFYAAYGTMVCVDKNFFVKDELINFDVDEIDNVLKFFVKGKIISLHAVTSFTGFPSVAGYSWNLFLLEILRKFSRQYFFHNLAPNSANASSSSQWQSHHGCPLCCQLNHFHAKINLRGLREFNRRAQKERLQI